MTFNPQDWASFLMPNEQRPNFSPDDGVKFKTKTVNRRKRGKNGSHFDTWTFISSSRWPDDFHTACAADKTTRYICQPSLETIAGSSHLTGREPARDSIPRPNRVYLLLLLSMGSSPKTSDVTVQQLATTSAAPTSPPVACSLSNPAPATLPPILALLK